MNKHFKIYGISWLIMFAIFNFVTFMTVGFAYGSEYFDAPFWIGYALVTLAFAGNFACTWYSTKTDSLKKFFLRMPLIRVSYISVVVCTVVGTAFMLLTKVMVGWIGGVIACLVLGFYVLSALRVILAAGIVEDVEERTEERTAFMRTLTVDAQCLVDRATTGEIRTELNRVYEAIRYSDSTTVPALAELEGEIRGAFSALKAAVAEGDAELVRAQATEVIALVEERRVKAKAYK